MELKPSTQPLETDINVADADDLIEATIKRKENEKLANEAQNRIFKFHKKALELLFLRLSTIDKRKLLKLLINQANDPVVISTILSSMNTILDKLSYYMKVMPETNYIYDKLISDHNRSIEGNDLILTIADNVEWFGDLQPVEQYTILLCLIRSCGSAILRSIYPILLDKNFTLQEMDIEKTSIISMRKESNFFYPTSTETEKINQMRKDFDQVLATFKKKVEMEKQKIDKLMKPPNKLPQEKNDKKKAKKSDKTSSKKGKKEANKIIDRIQLLPVFLSKKIFSYIDDKSLKKLKNVNSYWEYLIQDIIKERKMRKILDKMNKKTLEQLDEEFLVEIEQKQKFSSYDEQKRVVGKREEKLGVRGAILPKLKPDFTSGPNVETSLFSTLIKHKNLDDNLQLGENDTVLSFPRIFNQDALYMKKPCDSLGQQEFLMDDLDEDYLISISGTSVLYKVDIAKETELQDW